MREPKALRNLLQVFARVRGEGEPLRLMVYKAGPQTMLFRTQDDLGEGEDLTLQVLLPGAQAQTLAARVLWLVRSGSGLRGELQLSPEPRQEQLLEAFTQKQA